MNISEDVRNFYRRICFIEDEVGGLLRFLVQDVIYNSSYLWNKTIMSEVVLVKENKDFHIFPSNS